MPSVGRSCTSSCSATRARARRSSPPMPASWPPARIPRRPSPRRSGRSSRCRTASGSTISAASSAYRRINLDVSVDRERFPVRKLPAAESASMRAMFHTVMRRPVEARAAIAEARKADPKAAGSYVAEGILADRDNKVDEAKAAYTKAAELESTNAYAYFRLAQLTWQPNASKETLAAIEQLPDQGRRLQHAFRRRLRLAGRGARVSRQPRWDRPHPPRDHARPDGGALSPARRGRAAEPGQGRRGARRRAGRVVAGRDRPGAHEAQRLLDAATKAAAAPAPAAAATPAASRPTPAAAASSEAAASSTAPAAAELARARRRRAPARRRPGRRQRPPSPRRFVAMRSRT